MITFECPGCTKPLEANRAFAGFETRCLRCGSVILIPANSGDRAETLARGGLPKPRAAAPRPRPAPPPEPAFDPEPMAAGGGVAVAEPPAKRRTLKAESAPEPAAETTPAPAVDPKKKRKKKQRIIGGSVGGAILVIALLVNAFTGKKPTKPAPKRDEPQQVAQAPTPPPAVQPEPKVEPRKDVPPPPMPMATVKPPRPAAEHSLNLVSLLQEFNEGQAACNEKYDGKGLFIRGIYHSYVLGKITIVTGDETSVSISFPLLMPAEFKSGDVLPDPGLKPGQPVVLRTTYQSGCRFIDSTIELTDSPAEKSLLGKSVCLEGAIIRAVQPALNGNQTASLVLEPHATDSRIGVTCCFLPSDEEKIAKLKPGQKVDIRGKCTGRTYTKVRLDNCDLVTPESPATDIPHMTAYSFFTEFEADLLAAPRPRMDDPLIETMPVTAEGLGQAYSADPRSANITYRNKPIQLNGYVKERNPATRMIVMQCGTDTSHSVAAFFSPNDFENLPDEKIMVIRGVCSGTVGGYIRVDSCSYAALQNGAQVKRTEIDFLPYRFRKQHTYDMLVPGKGKDSDVRRMVISFPGGQDIGVQTEKMGKLTGVSLFRDPHPEARWSTNPPKFLPMVRHYRVTDGVVEIGQDYVVEDKGKREVNEYWEPVLKAGLKRGQSWSSKMPNGNVATYTVVDITQPMGADNEYLEIKKVVRDNKNPTMWVETSIVYARGIGEIRRIDTQKTDKGEAQVLLEQKLVSDGTGQIELRAKPPEPPK